MALVKEIRYTEGPLKGATVRIFDDAYAGISPEELRRRREAIAQEIRRIDYNVQLRELAKKGRGTNEQGRRDEPGT